MKTKSTHPTKIGEKTNTRNLFQKSFILLAILAFTSFGFKAKAQTFSTNVTNNAGLLCNWMIIISDASNNVLATYTSNGGSGLRTFGCDNGTPAEIVMTYTGGGCASYIFTGSSGIFLFQSVTPTCTPPATSCSTGITVQSSAATSTCPSPKVGDYVITININ